MTEQNEYQNETQFTQDTSSTPGAVPEADPTLQQLGALEQSGTATPADFNAVRERAAFETHVQTSGEPIPPNFRDAGAWFDSLKESQKQFTQSRQEIADLKKGYAETNAANPNYDPNAGAAPVQPASEITGDEMLRIEEPVAGEEEAPAGLTDEVWDAWGMEIAVKGDLTEETRASIKEMGFTDRMIEEFTGAHRVKLQNAYSAATKVVGSKDKLDTIFKWAASNLSKEEQNQINVGLAGPAYEITLRGLADMYSTNNVSKKANEPSRTQGVEPSSVAYDSTVGYANKREFYADRNNPRFTTDPSYRQAVEGRMLRTDFNKLNA
tara:strand:+ start:874 stop:1845 length:972 start_codon:yes stop_codon:yes gene_type:complete